MKAKTKQTKLELDFYEGDCLAFFLANDGYDSFINCIQEFGYTKKEAKEMAHGITYKVSMHTITGVYANA
jgi:hypothetical protein